MIPAPEPFLALEDNGMMVGKTVDMAVKCNAFADSRTKFLFCNGSDGVGNKIAGQDIACRSGKIKMSQEVHIQR